MHKNSHQTGLHQPFSLRGRLRDNSASKLLRDFANMHFPDQYGLAKATHEEEYQKRHERLDERIKEMKKAEKAAAKKDEKQNVSPALPNDDKAA